MSTVFYMLQQIFICFYAVGMKILEKALAWKAQAAAMAIGGLSVDPNDDGSLAKKRKVDELRSSKVPSYQCVGVGVIWNAADVSYCT